MYLLLVFLAISSLRDWNEQNASKKDSDSSAATSGARDKRCVLLEAQSPGYFILTFLSFRRDQEDAGTFVIPLSHCFVHSPPLQRSFPHAPPSDQR
jgi:hypothetical protein